MNTNQPIGVIDSGLGGLSILRHLTNDLPCEGFVYFADSIFCPYGKRNFHEIRGRAFLIVEYLLNIYNVKLVVVACNTLTAAAIDELRAKYSIPFVGMEPAIKPAALNTKTGVIGVLATEGTFNGKLFKQTQEKYASDIKVIVQAGNGLVELIEKGITDGYDIERLLNKYLKPMKNSGVDLLALGCTHYPFLLETINKMYPDFKIIDPAPAISKHTATVLNKHGMKNLMGTCKNPTVAHHRQIDLLTTGQADDLQKFAKKIIHASFTTKTITL